MIPRLDPIVWTTQQRSLLGYYNVARDYRSEAPRPESLRRFIASALGLPMESGPGAWKRTETERPRTGEKL